MAPPDWSSRQQPGSVSGTDLRSLLRAIDGGPFQAYRRTLGVHELGEFRLEVISVPPDALAGAARVRLSIDRTRAGLDGPWSRGDLARTVLEDSIVRAAVRAVSDLTGPAATSAPGSGRVWIDPPGPGLSERTAACVGDDTLDVCLAFDLPAATRRVRGQQAEAVIFEQLPRVAMAALLFPLRRVNDLKPQIAALARRRFASGALSGRGLAVVIPSGALPGRAIPHARCVEIETPNGPVSGLGVPAGLTLFVSAGVNGAGTWLRELVADSNRVSGQAAILGAPAAVLHVARRRHGPLDLRAFVQACPEVPDPSAYQSEDPPAPLGLAASLVEAVESGARVLLLDEDDIPAGAWGGPTASDGIETSLRPLVPMTERLADLRDRWGLSFLIAARPSSRLFGAADSVFVLGADGIDDATQSCRRAARTRSDELAPPSPRSMRIVVDAPVSGLKVAAWGARGVRVGEDLVDLSDTSLVGEPARLRATAALLKRAAAIAPMWRPVEDVLDDLETASARIQLDDLEEAGLHDLARPTRLELGGALVRWKRVTFRMLTGTLSAIAEERS